MPGRGQARAPTLYGFASHFVVGYGRGQDGRRYAVVDTGRELRAFRADDAELAVGRSVRASAHQVEGDRRQQLLWRLGADERERERG